MSDKMRAIPFSKLMNWVLTEYKNDGSVFGVSKMPRHTDGKAMPIFNREKIESPIGPAAGPNTQLAQNIIASYVAGSRFFELKTVQVIDGEDLSKNVNKPCIAAADECYNCEWSTELTVPAAFDEYVRGWFACKLLAKELDLGDPEAFVFNMSVGYDLNGIKSEKVNKFIDDMQDASKTEVWSECMEWTLGNLDKFKNVDEAYVKSISPVISKSVTESTLHGCPPDEIEKIAAYLLGEKGLHTYIKCNPTLLGYDFARKTLNDLGYSYIVFDDRHFKGDLQKEDAIPMFRRLQKLADGKGLEFGVKLTNTFPVDVAAGELPSEEMYMSGKSLFPLSISLAEQLSKEFDGKLRISYAGGADIFSVKPLYDAGIWPITMATTVLKPGGYQRFNQMGLALIDCEGEWKGVDVAAVSKLAEEARTGNHYRKPIKPLPTKKLNDTVPLIDCFTAPCKGGCPINQDVPAYLMAMGGGDPERALEIITERNPLPFTTGTICGHRCMDKCMRGNVDESVRIRDIKLKAARGGFDKLLPKLKPRAAEVTNKKVAVIGAGPAGLAAAFFLGRAGVKTTVFERRDNLGGVLRYQIPEFRIDTDAIDKDIAIVKSMGAEFVTGKEVRNAKSLLDEGYTDVIFAVGAEKHGSAGLKYGETLNASEFLEKAKSNPDSLNLGKHVIVIGGGNSAMDAARAAKRISGVEDVKVVYRRTKRYMPALEEELELAESEGVEFMELLAPIGVENGKLECSVMELGAPDASGRRSPVDTGKTASVDATAVIAAIGERVDSSIYESNGMSLDNRGKAVVDPKTLESTVKHIYVIGDGHTGPATVVEAIADAMKASNAISGADCDKFVEYNRKQANYGPALSKRGDICTDCDNAPDSRCLGCATVCETCTSVCPNRANVAVRVPGRDMRQIIHVDGMCNECGNCAVFCPYSSRPYKDKITLFWSVEDFNDSDNTGFVKLENGKTRVRLFGSVADYDVSDPKCGLFDAMRDTILAVYKDYSYLL